ncbi:hypothetical protein SB775_01300 [Peribacillus sp. SIMBA_075]|uniref:hypothetical protein n=1 Tax=Peribacillus sp. SIMBA_075 TaxID=3085813 RepID=UPI000B755542|nr:hypothetical protein SAMN05444672_104263 [Bacillus sp. OK838]
MSLKAIEMQIAIPRTQDAGKIQEQSTKEFNPTRSCCPSSPKGFRTKTKDRCR